MYGLTIQKKNSNHNKIFYHRDEINRIQILKIHSRSQEKIQEEYNQIWQQPMITITKLKIRIMYNQWITPTLIYWIKKKTTFTNTKARLHHTDIRR